MQRSKLLLVATCSAGLGLAVGCETQGASSVGTVEFGPGGLGGSGARAGAPGSTGGMAGTGPGAGGTGTGGSAADAGGVEAGGGGGALGQAGHTGGTGPGGTGGVSGSTGAGGGTTEHKLCAEACDRDADCVSSLSDQPFGCNRATRRCEGFAAPCRSEAECIPGASQWFWSCTSDADCFFFSGDVCVDIAGVGRCARPAPQPDASTGGCVFPVPDALVLPRFASGGTVLVCADASQKCREGSCIVPCRNDAQCTPDRNGSICNQETGLCECVADQDCRGPGVSRCNTATRRCECAGEIDCENALNADTCVGGRCGCSSVAACNAERVFSGTSYVCE